LERQQPEASQSKALIENVDIHNHPDINHDVAKTEDDRIQIQQSDLNLSAKRNRKDRPGFHKNANSSTVIAFPSRKQSRGSFGPTTAA